MKDDHLNSSILPDFIYQKLASLQHCVLVERDQIRVEIFDRLGDAWSTTRMCISLAEIYRDVLTA